jgi:hypothetical protein
MARVTYVIVVDGSGLTKGEKDDIIGRELCDDAAASTAGTDIGCLRSRGDRENAVRNYWHWQCCSMSYP